MAVGGDAKIRVSGATALPAYIASAGGSPLRVLHESGVVAAELRDSDGWLSLDRIAALFEAAAIELDDPYCGLRFGATIPLQAYGLLSYVVLNAADVATALDNLGRYSGKLSVSGVVLDFSVVGDTARMEFTLGSANADAYRQYVEATAAVLCVMMKALAGPDWVAREIHFEHSAAGDPAQASEHLGAPTRYGAKRHAVWFDAAYRQRIVAHADRGLLPVIEKNVIDIVGDTDEDALVSAVRNELAAVLCDGNSDLECVAARLAMSSRTLQRRLQRRGVRFKRLVNETRTDLAKQYLAGDGPTVTEIAFLLGYGELSAFDRAFRRETGMSPTRWRRRLREDHST